VETVDIERRSDEGWFQRSEMFSTVRLHDSVAL
jgi:hypothetical protein